MNGIYAFEISIHPHEQRVDVGGSVTDEHGSWPILTVSRESLERPLGVGCDETLSRLAALPRLYAEPDGSFVWVSPAIGGSWQVDGNIVERQGRVLLAELKGSCPADAFDRLLAAFGWPGEPLVFQLVRAGVFLDEATFRRHAAARGSAGDGQTLRPR